MGEFDSSTILLYLLHPLRENHDSARAGLIAHVQERVRRLARHMFHRQPSLRQLDDTDDVLQKGQLCLHQALASVRPDSSPAGVRPEGTAPPRPLADPPRRPPRVAHAGDRAAGLCGTEDNLDDLKELALHSEFTWFGTIADSKLLADPVDVWWEMAQRVHGWGKLQLVLLGLCGTEDNFDDLKELALHSEFTWFGTMIFCGLENRS
jgi:hypothetical protein